MPAVHGSLAVEAAGVRLTVPGTAHDRFRRLQPVSRTLVSMIAGARGAAGLTS